MIENNFLPWAVSLLEEIHSSSEKQTWCQYYSPFLDYSDQDQLHRILREFTKQAYEVNLILPNYKEILDASGFQESAILRAEENWVKVLSKEQLLACISWHFRRDHFIEGSLISESIATGALLRLMRYLIS